MIINTGLTVLHTTKYGENSLIVHTLGEEFGRRSFLVRKVGRQAAASLFLPLNVLDAEIIPSSKSTLYTARNLSARYPLFGIRNNIFKNAMTMFMSEVLYKVIKDGVNEPGLFGWCEKNILMLDAIETDFSNFHLRFLLELAAALGFSPETSALLPFAGEDQMIVTRLGCESFAEAMLVPLTGPHRNRIAEELLRYIQYHTDSFFEVSSLKVLRELFA